jgi:hypothetical protein
VTINKIDRLAHGLWDGSADCPTPFPPSVQINDDCAMSGAVTACEQQDFRIGAQPITASIDGRYGSEPERRVYDAVLMAFAFAATTSVDEARRIIERAEWPTSAGAATCSSVVKGLLIYNIAPPGYRTLNFVQCS